MLLVIFGFLLSLLYCGLFPHSSPYPLGIVLTLKEQLLNLPTAMRGPPVSHYRGIPSGVKISQSQVRGAFLGNLSSMLPPQRPPWTTQDGWLSVSPFSFSSQLSLKEREKKKRPLWTHPFLSQIILFNEFPIRPNPMRWNFCHACHPAQKGFENSQKLVRGENMWRDSTRSFPSMVAGPPLPRCVQIWAELWSHCSRKEKATVLP